MFPKGLIQIAVLAHYISTLNGSETCDSESVGRWTPAVILTLDSIACSWRPLINSLWGIDPACFVICTVSAPLRAIKSLASGRKIALVSQESIEFKYFCPCFSCTTYYLRSVSTLDQDTFLHIWRL